MIISRTPFRISFFGGGTDYPTWYRENGGAVLATTIDKYCYISCRALPPFFDHKQRIVYSKIEQVNDIREIQHPAVRGVMEALGVNEGLEIHHDGDLPARSGLGSSSSFTVGMINAIKAYRNELISKRDLANLAIHVEQEVIRENVGCQDQISAAYGGLNRIDFNRDDTFSVTPLFVAKERREELESNLMLFFTGFSRTASDIAKAQIENIGNRRRELSELHQMVDEATSIVQSRSTHLDDFGLLLDEAWKLKRTLSSKITNPKIDEIYEAAMRAGALGGKLLGAGGGGFMLFYAHSDAKPRIRQALRDLLHVSFSFESSGSKIVLYDPQLLQAA